MTLDTLGYTHNTMATTTGRDGAIPSQSSESHPQFGLRSATRPHEVGIASNRGSEYHGEYVLEPCTHRPPSQKSREYPKFPFIGTEGKFDN